METQVLGLSVDSTDCLKAWAESLGGITYPLLSDFWPHGEIARRYGVLRSEGYSERAIFVIDKRGVIRYVDVHDISQQPDNDELFRVLAEVEPQLAAKMHLEDARQPVADAVPPAAGVRLYCTSWCPQCRQARAFLSQNAITYTEIDITHDRPAAARVRSWARGYETTPTFEINGEIVVGFDRARIAELLGIKL